VGREGVDVGGDEVVGDYATQEIEPEERHLRQDAALSRDALGQNAIEGRNTIGRDYQKIVAYAVYVADLAAPYPFGCRVDSLW